MDTSNLVFIRDIPESKITDELVNQYIAKGCTIVYKTDSIEIWG